MSLRLIFLTLTLLTSLAAKAVPLCAQVLDEAALDDPDKEFVRGPTPHLDPVYRQNMQKVAHDFDEALHGQRDTVDFLRFLADQHRAAVLGLEAGTFYWPDVHYLRNGQTVPSNFADAQALAGKYRFELRIVAPDQALIQEVAVDHDTVVEIKQRTKDQKTASTYSSGVPTQYFLPHIDGIPVTASPRYTFTGVDRIKYEYPAANDQKLYLEEMHKGLDLIIHGVLTGDRDGTLKALARYYHVAMIGHPFMRVNNSMVMTEINVTLKELGLKPVYHGSLDFLVRSLDTEQATAAFIDYVMRNQ